MHISDSKIQDSLSTDAEGRAGSLNRTDDVSRVVVRHHFPAVPVVIAYVLGITADRWFDVAWVLWLSVGTVSFLAWVFLVWRRNQHAAAGCILVSCVLLGAAHHHQVWSVATGNDLSRFATERPRLARVFGTVVGQPYVIPKKKLSAWQQLDRSVCTIQCRSLVTDDGPEPVSGLARLTVKGHLLHVGIGDEVEVLAELSRPRPRQNAGDFDFRSYLRGFGIRVMLHAGHPDAVRRIEAAERSGGPVSCVDGIWRVRGRMRNDCESLFQNHLSAKTAPIAKALLLGSRTSMDNDVRAAFVESGTMHLLAISGLHVGILAAFLWAACRLLNVSPAATMLVLLLGIGGYAFVTDARPPVIRATIIIMIWAAGIPWHRRAMSANTLAIAALLVLLIRPSDLFNVGAQLSFLAITAILWSSSRGANPIMIPAATPTPEQMVERSWIRRRAVGALGVLLRLYIVSFTIWLFTAPLVAFHFNLVAPVGILINVLLIPVVMLALWFGYGLVLAGFLAEPAVPFFAAGFDASLGFLMFVVEAASRFELGHVYVPSPPIWWMAGIYGVLAAMICLRVARTWKRWAWSAAALWLIFGLSIALYQQSEPKLRCSFLAVGHGCSVLVETPSGRTLLYDAGMINDGDRARDVVSRTLWSHGLSRIDAVVISHADVDHFNAVPELLRTVPVGSLLISQTFLDFDQAGVVDVCETASAERIPIRLVSRGDELLLDDDVRLRILHPSNNSPSSSDNANSIVLEIAYAGRTILLTGDLEDEGLTTLMNEPRRNIDVILSPHHGSLNANPQEFADWAQPAWVIVSGGRSHVLPTLRNRYAASHVHSTIEDGAVSFEIDATGGIRYQPFVTVDDERITAVLPNPTP